MSRRVLLASAALIAAAAFVRIAGIADEPFWLDEIFSHDFTGGTISETVQASARDAHPPLYFVALNLWRRIGGDSIAWERGLSTLWSLMGILALVALAREVRGGDWSAGLTAGLLAVVSPLDVYFAQEARMYAQAAALGVLSTWVALRWIRLQNGVRWSEGWPWLAAYGGCALAMLGTHYVTVTVLLAQGLFLLGWLLRRTAWRPAIAYGASALGVALLFLPWLKLVRDTRGALYSAERTGWIPTPTLDDGWLFFGRDLLWGDAGFARGEWTVAYVAAALVWLFVAARVFARPRSIEGRVQGVRDEGFPAVAFIMWMLAVPALLAVGISTVWQPIFFRPRFAVLVLPFALATVAAACWRGRTPFSRVAPLAMLACGLSFATVTQANTSHKTGLGEFAELWRSEGPPDYVLFFPRYNRRVAGYYLGEPVMNVPSQKIVEEALRGDRPVRLWICARRDFPRDGRNEESTALMWALGLGPHRRIVPVDRVEEVIEVVAQPVARVYPRLPIDGRIDFADPAAGEFLWSGWHGPERDFRWSRGTEAHVLFALADQDVHTLTLEMFCYLEQTVGILLNGVEVARFECSERSPHERSFELVGDAIEFENDILFELPRAISPKQAGRGNDQRRLAVGIRWIRLK